MKENNLNFSNDINFKIKGDIYIIVNDINNKVYIGQTREGIEERFKRHCRNYQDSKGSIDYDITFYGKEHFKIKLIEKVFLKDLDEREKYWINFYNSYKKGYNRTIGGDGGGIYTQEEINKALSLYYQGKPMNIIQNEIGISPSCLFKYIKNNNLEKRETTEYQKEISIKNAKKATEKNLIPVKNITLNIQYSSKKEALIDMINKGYSKAKDWHNIRTGLDKALKEKIKFLNFEWEIINE